MYTNLHLAGLGGFASEFYWSSTELGITVAWSQNFDAGNQGKDNKDNDLNVRAIRAF